MRQLNRPDDRPEHRARASTTRRLIWFIGLWCASVAVIGTIAWLIRLWIL